VEQCRNERFSGSLELHSTPCTRSRPKVFFHFPQTQAHSLTDRFKFMIEVMQMLTCNDLEAEGLYDFDFDFDFGFERTNPPSGSKFGFDTIEGTLFEC
jgi:hypothetical protein